MSEFLTSFPREEPFAHPLALARQTEKWPDVVAICGAGTALVDPMAFEETLVLLVLNVKGG